MSYGTVEAGIEQASEPDVRAEVARTDRRAARIVARGLDRQARAEALARRAQAEADAAQTRRAARAQQRAETERRREARRARRRAWWAAAAHWMGQALAAGRRQAAAGFSLLVYAVVVYVAATSQMQVFRVQFGWTVPRAAAAAIFIEGLGLAFALTAHALRLRGERAYGLRALTWAAALFAGAMNYGAHVVDPNLTALMAQLQAIAVGASSLAGIVLWEARSGARSRTALREAAKKALPKPYLGWDFCLRYPRRAFWAWSAMVADPQVRTREKAIEQGQRLWEEYRARKRAGARARSTWAQRRRLAGQRRHAHAARQALLDRAAGAAQAAVRDGQTGPAVMYLRLLAECETIRPQRLGAGSDVSAEKLAGPSGEPVDSAAEPTPGPERAGCDCGPGLGAVAAALEALTARCDQLGQGLRWPNGGPASDADDLWQQRLDELDAAYRAEDGTELPIPARRQVIARMGLLDRPRFAWTNHDIVDRARKDLETRRDSIYRQVAPDEEGAK